MKCRSGKEKKRSRARKQTYINTLTNNKTQTITQTNTRTDGHANRQPCEEKAGGSERKLIEMSEQVY